jgi:hypothetical protein
MEILLSNLNDVMKRLVIPADNERMRKFLGSNGKKDLLRERFPRRWLHDLI